MTQQMIDKTHTYLYILNEELETYLLSDLCKLCSDYVTSAVLLFEDIFLRTMLARRIWDYALRGAYVDLLYSHEPVVVEYLQLVRNSVQGDYGRHYDDVDFEHYLLRVVLFNICSRRSSVALAYYLVCECRRRGCYMNLACCC